MVSNIETCVYIDSPMNPAYTYCIIKKKMSRKTTLVTGRSVKIGKAIRVLFVRKRPYKEAVSVDCGITIYSEFINPYHPLVSKQ
jgi:hypothetical protein